MKAKISDRPMFKKPTDETDVENVGIMQGFMDSMEEDDSEDEYEMDDNEATKVADRRPNSPEILMNNLRGDMRSIDARVEELADLVGYNAAADTPEDVLALLQPVFAQQQAVPMPPQGGIPPAPMPQGMPEMAPEGMPMPPEASMGGIGALAMDQGAMPQEPVAMAMGGYVQNFKDGTDEDGVTPIEDTSSFPAGLYDDDMLAKARARVLATARQQPQAMPGLEAGVDSRTALYERLLGSDKNQTQAQLLFELGNRAFNYAANVDDQGRPLRGSQAARLAGAVRTLPTAVGAITAEDAKQKRAIRALAISASEKDIENVRDYNAKLAATQQKYDVAALKAGSASALPKSEWANSIISTPGLLERYGQGNTSVDENRAVMMAALELFKPTISRYTDDKGRVVETVVPGTEHPEVVDAFMTRGTMDQLRQSLAGKYSGTGKAPAPAPAPVPGATSAEPTGQAEWTGGIIPEKQLNQLRTAAQNGDKDAQDALLAYERSLKKNTPKIAYEPFNEPTYYGAIEGAFGLGSYIGDMVSKKIPYNPAGEIAVRAQQDTAIVENLAPRIKEALRATTKLTEGERVAIDKYTDLGISAFKSESAAKNSVIGLARTLYTIRKDAEKTALDKNLDVTVTNEAAAKAAEVDKVIKMLGAPPPVSTQQEYADLPMNSEYLIYDAENRTWTPKIKTIPWSPKKR
jgi:hypothetical protein